MNNDIQVQEYISLRQELKDQKKFIFERPLFLFFGILTVESLINTEVTIFMPIVFTFLMYFSYSFSISRLKVIERIIAYLKVVHESNLEGWNSGWETYLAVSRKHWSEPDNKIETKDHDFNPVEETFSFTRSIFFTHLLLAAPANIFC